MGRYFPDELARFSEGGGHAEDFIVAAMTGSSMGRPTRRRERGEGLVRLGRCRCLARARLGYSSPATPIPPSG